MIIIRSNLLVTKGWGGWTVFPFIVIRKKLNDEKRTIRHENIHIRQQAEMLVIPFFIVYLIELIAKGYRNISFEKEAYENSQDVNYLAYRKFWAWTKYLKA